MTEEERRVRHNQASKRSRDRKKSETNKGRHSVELIQDLICIRCESPTPRNSGSQKYCPECAKNRDRRAWSKQYYENNKDQFFAANKKRRAKVRGVVATLTQEEWDNILLVFNFECVYCGDPWEQQDHFTPLSKGGNHTADNVVPACASCNSKKYNKDALEFIGCGPVLVARKP